MLILKVGEPIKRLKEIDFELPNGFHDAQLESLTINYASNRAELNLEVWVGSPDAATQDERDACKPAKLTLIDLVYFVIDPPDLTNHYGYSADAVCIDAGDATDDSNPKSPKPRGAVPPDAFAYWFYVRNWNSFIHVAARGATLEWM